MHLSLASFPAALRPGCPGRVCSRAVLLAALALVWPASESVAQAPVVDVLSPNLAVAGDPGFTLMVEGSNFIAPTFGPAPAPGTVVRFPSQFIVAPGEALPTTFVDSTKLTVMVPGSDTTLTRGGLAQLTVLSQLTEQGITAYLNSTGGIFCSFADVSCPPVGSGTVTDSTGVSGGWRYIETLYRLGYTAGCFEVDAQRRFCPTSSANILGTPAVRGVSALTVLVGPPPSATSSAPVDFTIVAPTPTPTLTPTPTSTPTATPTPTPLPPQAIPTASETGLVALLALLAVAGVVALRARHNGS
jgi:hypothetical protein